jgi:hypothetical protein
MTTLVDPLFDPMELLDVAEELINNPTEPKVRTVMNRCYYSCYLMVKKSKSQYRRPGYELSHKYVRTKLLNNTAQSFYMNLLRCRLAADYELDHTPTVSVPKGSPPSTIPFTKKKGKRAIRDAKEFLKEYNGIIFCPNCGKRNLPKSRSCKCGKTLIK